MYTRFTPKLHKMLRNQRYTRVTQGLHNGYTKFTDRLHPSYTRVTPKAHAITLWLLRLHPGYTNDARRLHPSDTQVTGGLRPSHTWDTPGLRPSTPELCPSLYLPMPGYVNPINTRCSVAPPPHPVYGWVAVARGFCTNVVPRLRPSHTCAWKAGYALDTPLSRPGYDQATLE